MTRQLVAFVDSLSGGSPDPGGTPPAPSAFDRWPAIEHARTGGFDHVIMIANVRFRWDEVIGHVADRPLVEPTPPAAEPAAAAPATTEAAPGAAAEPAPESRAEEEPMLPFDPPPEESAPETEPAAETDHHDDEAHEDASASTSSDAPSGDVADHGETKRLAPGERRLPPNSIENLRSRLRHMAQTGRIDRGALESLGRELGRELGIESVACRVIPPFARDREQVSTIRSVLGLIRAHEPVALDFADGPRSAAGLGLTLAHGLASLRPDVPLTELVMDRARNLAFHPKSLLHAIEIQELWRAVARGTTPMALVEHMRADPRLQGLAAPYQRYARAIEFGSPAEAARAARTVQQRVAEMTAKPGDRDDWIAAIQPALDAMTGSLVQEQPWSRRQIWMAEAAARRGMHLLTALHIREALISALLEAYGQNAARGWAPAQGENPDARIRPREVMAVILGDPHSFKLVPDLGEVWKWVGNPRLRFVMTSPVAVDPAILRDANHALTNLPALSRAILDENRFKSIVEALPYEAAIEVAVSRNAVRIAPLRGRRLRRGAGDGPHEHEHGDDGPHEGAEGSESGGQSDAPPAQRPPREPRRDDRPRFQGPPRDRRPPRPDRPAPRGSRPPARDHGSRPARRSSARSSSARSSGLRPPDIGSRRRRDRGQPRAHGARQPRLRAQERGTESDASRPQGAAAAQGRAAVV